MRGARGAELAPLGNATITVEGISTVTASRDKFGDYYRPLAPGRYMVMVSKDGYKPFSVNLTVPADGSGAQRHFVLAREDSSSSSDVAFNLRSLEPSSSSDDSGTVLPWKAGRKGGSAVIEPGSTVSAASRSRDRSLMLGAGAVVVYGLWVTHRRLSPRSLMRRR